MYADAVILGALEPKRNCIIHRRADARRWLHKLQHIENGPVVQLKVGVPAQAEVDEPAL